MGKFDETTIPAAEVLILQKQSAGYGNIAPSNTIGRMFVIFYALIGIPVNGFLFAYLGDFFGKAVREPKHTTYP